MPPERGVAQTDNNPTSQERASGVVEESRTAVLDSTTCYFIRLNGENVFYAISEVQNREAITLNVGDTVSIDYTVSNDGFSILDANILAIEG